MPSTRPRPSREPTKESIRTAVIVGLVIGLLGFIVLSSLLYQRRLRRNIKAGTIIGKWGVERQERGGKTTWKADVEKGLEVGIIQEPLPVYAKEAVRGEKQLEMGMVR